MLVVIISRYWDCGCFFILSLHFSEFPTMSKCYFYVEKIDTLKHQGLERSSSLIKYCEKKFKGHLVFSCSQFLHLDAEAKLSGS